MQRDVVALAVVLLAQRLVREQESLQLQQLGQALERPKPAPDLFLHAAGRLGVDPAACVVVEDSAAGARAARAAGMRCFGYAPKGAHDGLLAEGAVLFNDMAELPALLGV